MTNNNMLRAAIWLFICLVGSTCVGQSMLKYATPSVSGPIQKIEMYVYANGDFGTGGTLNKGTLNSCAIFEYQTGLPMIARMYSGGGPEPSHLTSTFEYQHENAQLVQIDEYIRQNYFSKSVDLILSRKNYIHYNEHLISHEIVEDAAGRLIARYVYCQSLQLQEPPLYEWANEIKVDNRLYGIRYRDGIVDLNYTLVDADTAFLKKGKEIEDDKYLFIFKRSKDAQAIEYTETIDKRDNHGNITRLIRVPKDVNQQMIVIEYKYSFE